MVNIIYYRQRTLILILTEHRIRFNWPIAGFLWLTSIVLNKLHTGWHIRVGTVQWSVARQKSAATWGVQHMHFLFLIFDLPKSIHKWRCNDLFFLFRNERRWSVPVEKKPCLLLPTLRSADFIIWRESELIGGNSNWTRFNVFRGSAFWRKRCTKQKNSLSTSWATG